MSSGRVEANPIQGGSLAERLSRGERGRDGVLGGRETERTTKFRYLPVGALRVAYK